MIVKCDYCGQEFLCSPSRYFKAKEHCCSKECQSKIRKSKNLNCECEICGKTFHRKQSWIDKNEHQYCSQDCKHKADKILFQGEGNHQFGLLGEKNPSWKGGRKISFYGYVLIYCPKHPFANIDGNVFEHRLVAEKHLLTPETSVEINGQLYLSPKYVVHHKDFNRQNNSVDNLQIMTCEEHLSYHNSLRVFERNERGQFIRKEELYENQY